MSSLAQLFSPGAAQSQLLTSKGHWIRRARRLGCLWLAPAIAILLLAGCGRENATTVPSTTSLPQMLVFGDSYTQGSGAEPRTSGYAYQLGAKLGWEVTVDGSGGTGYLNPGSWGAGTYLTRATTAAPKPFDVIILQGSTNDESQPLAQLAPAVDATVSAFRVKYPGARIILMGPVALGGWARPSMRSVNETLKTYASSHDCSFVDPIADAWFTPEESTAMVNPADGHPSNEGHLRIRDRLVTNLLKLGVPAVPR